MSSNPAMAHTSRPGQFSAHILLAGAGLGVMANYLLWPGGLNGPGFAVWIALLASAALWLVRNIGEVRIRVIALWGTLAVAGAFVLIFRNIEVLLPATWLLILAVATMIFLHVRGIGLMNARVPDVLKSFLQIPVLAIAGAPSLLRHIDLPAVSRNRRWQGVVRGLVIALPLLLTFSLLFASADAGFSRLVPDLTTIFSGVTLGRMLLTLLFAWLSTGLLMGVCELNAPLEVQPVRRFQLGAEETGVVMGLLSALFVVFVTLQASYLFGGRETIEATTGLTVAEYARRGFFELVVVAGLTLLVLLVLGAASVSQRLFRILAAVLIGCVMVILASALQRFNLYIEAYGLTIDRLVALTVMAWLTLSLILFSATALRGRSAGFASGVVVCGISIILVFGLLNPAAQVARINIERLIQNQQQEAANAQPALDIATSANASGRSQLNIQFDLYYLLSLGSDAVPVLLAHLDQLAPLEQCVIAGHLLSQWNNEEDTSDWRAWNASRATAQRAVREKELQLQQLFRLFNPSFDFTNRPVPQPVPLSDC